MNGPASRLHEEQQQHLVRTIIFRSVFEHGGADVRSLETSSRRTMQDSSARKGYDWELAPRAKRQKIRKG